MPDRPGLITPPPRQYKVAVFDYDGTLVDSARVYPFIHKEVLRELGVPEEDIEYMTLDYWYGNINTNKHHIDVPAYLIERHGLQDRTDALDFRSRRNRIELEYFRGERDVAELGHLTDYIIIPVMDNLRRMYEEGAECYIVSHNYGIIIEAAMKTLGIDSMITDCFTHCAYEELRHPTYDRSQPKEDSFAWLVERARKLGGGAGDCVVYDDLRQHVESARALGMDAVWVDNEHGWAPHSK